VIAVVANDLLPRLRKDPQLCRFWAQRGEDGIRREKQLLIDFLCEYAGGPMYYRDRDILFAHRGLGISQNDWNVFLGHAAAACDVPSIITELRRDILVFRATRSPSFRTYRTDSGS
jgi:hemoglobin